MKLTRQEIILLLFVVAALVGGDLVRRYRQAHPVVLPASKPAKQK